MGHQKLDSKNPNCSDFDEQDYGGLDIDDLNIDGQLFWTFTFRIVNS